MREVADDQERFLLFYVGGGVLLATGPLAGGLNLASRLSNLCGEM